MATRSLIVRKVKNGYEAIYCHWDGYPEHNGKILQEHYVDPEKVEKLFENGSLSYLAPEIGEKNDFSKPDPKVCLFYHRDRGEPWENVEPIKVDSISDFFYQDGEPPKLDFGQEYVYLFFPKERIWECYTVKGNWVF